MIKLNDFTAEALRSLCPSGWAWNGGDVKPVSDPKPTDAEIQSEMDRLEAEYDAQAYARNRKVEYDALNQFEMQYDDKANGTTTWEDAIDAIKTKYPKG